MPHETSKKNASSKASRSSLSAPWGSSNEHACRRNRMHVTLNFGLPKHKCDEPERKPSHRCTRSVLAPLSLTRRLYTRRLRCPVADVGISSRKRGRTKQQQLFPANAKLIAKDLQACSDNWKAPSSTREPVDSRLACLHRFCGSEFGSAALFRCAGCRDCNGERKQLRACVKGPWELEASTGGTRANKDCTGTL